MPAFTGHTSVAALHNLWPRKSSPQPMARMGEHLWLPIISNQPNGSHQCCGGHALVAWWTEAGNQTHVQAQGTYELKSTNTPDGSITYVYRSKLATFIFVYAL
jgi:hypothetical protein